jgi:aspartate/methionine/tyrosine aminotransferase
LPEPDLRSLRHSLSHYADGKGEIRLREAVVKRYRKQYGLEINPEKNVIITHGGAQAFSLAVLAATEEGDEVIIPDPTYMLYANACALLGRVPVRPPKTEDEGFVLTVPLLKKSISQRSRLLVLNSPENPTGVVYSQAELKQLYEACVQAKIVLLQDEVYDSFVLDGEHWSCTAFDPSLSNAMQLNSMSKRYGLPGLRIGWLIADERTISAAAKALEYLSLSVSALSHYFAEKILSDPEVETWIDETREQVRARRDMLRDALRPLGFIFPPRGGCGAFFLFPNISAFAQKIGAGENVALGDLFTDWIARNAKIAVVPGSVYGAQGRNNVRLVTTGDSGDLQLAITRFKAALGESSINSSGLTRVCARASSPS